MSYPRGRRAALRNHNDHQLDSRVRRLEELMGSLLPERAHREGLIDHRFMFPKDCMATTSNRPYSFIVKDVESSEIEPGRVTANDGQLTYVSSTHWAAVCDEVGNSHCISNRHG